MTDGPTKIAEYGNEILAVNAMQVLKDHGIEARVLEGGIAMQIPRYELYVKASQAAEARALLEELEAESPAETFETEGDEHPEADCEGEVD
jgi:hypothetical protein